METYSYEDEDGPQKREEKRPRFGVLEGRDKAVTSLLGTKSLGQMRSWHPEWTVPKYFGPDYPGPHFTRTQRKFQKSRNYYLRVWEGFQCKQALLP